MKTLLLASTVLLGTAVYAQNTLVAVDDSVNNANLQSYQIKEVVISDMREILLGELDAKSKKSKPVGRDAYYFENKTQGNNFFLESFFFKVDRAKYRTKLQVHLYKKKNYTEEVYLETGTLTYPSFVPGDEIKTEDIIVYINPGRKGLVEVDLLQFDIVIPMDGVFVSLELISYLDESGAVIKRSKFKEKELTTIDFHPSTTDNYCGTASVYGTDDEFWINSNKRLRTDYIYAFKKEAPEKMLVAPNFGLKVGRK